MRWRTVSVESVRSGSSSIAAGAQILVGVGLGHLVRHREVVRHGQRAAGWRRASGRSCRSPVCWGSRSSPGWSRRPRSRTAGRCCPSCPRRAAAGHPDRRPRVAVGRDVEYARLRQRGLVVAHDPAGVGRDVAVRGPAGIDDTLRQQQRRTLLVLPRLEAGRDAARRRIGCGDLDRAR